MGSGRLFSGSRCQRDDDCVNHGAFLTFQAVIRRNQIQSLDGVVDGSGMPTGIWPNNCANGIVEENVIDLNNVNNGPAVRQVGSSRVRFGVIPEQRDILRELDPGKQLEYRIVC